MFTGLVQALGKVALREGPLLRIAFSDVWVANDPLALGESVAINGCCLTVVRCDASSADFELSEETYRRTALRSLAVGSPINLERAMRMDARFGGHIVQGHVDTVGKVTSRTPDGEFVVFGFDVGVEGDRYLIDKGSIALDGISLTVCEPDAGKFTVWTIPHTLEVTNLGLAQPGDLVNVEFDVIAKHVERLMAAKEDPFSLSRQN